MNHYGVFNAGFFRNNAVYVLSGAPVIYYRNNVVGICLLCDVGQGAP